MKKTRRLLSMLLATVMVLTLVVPALAEDVTPTQTGGASKTGSTTDPITEIEIEKTVTVDTANTSLPTETFYFRMAPATEDELKDDDGKRITIKDSTVEIEPGIALNDPVISIDFDASDSTRTKEATKTKKFALEFTENFKGQGVYRYYIQEVKAVETEGSDGTKTTTYEPVAANDSAYIEYDTSKYIVDLYVNYDADGKLVVTNTVVQKVDSEYKPNAISFVNKISCTTVVIKKKVEGITYKQDEAFTFHIMIPVGGDTIKLAAGETVQCAVYDKKDTLIENAPKTLTVGGDDENATVSDYNEFTLHDGDYMVIYAPLSMIFKVEEEDYSDEKYTTTATYEESGTLTKSTTVGNNGKKFDDANDFDQDADENDTTDGIVTVKGTANSNQTMVTFINTRLVNVETGINLDFLPYVLVLVGALAAAGVWFFFRKRRTVR